MAGRNDTPNDNRCVIRMLAENFSKCSKGRNRILLCAVILSILTLTLVFGISYGKIRGEYLQTIREEGTAASGRLQGGDASQYALIRSLEYIRWAGRSVPVGAARSQETTSAPGQGEEEVADTCAVSWLDSAAWADLFRPAYTDIHGSYPEAEQEIMLSQRGMEALGIKDPKEGMEISLDISIGLFGSSKETFVLSGWFTEYGTDSAPAYISRAKLESWGFSVDEEADILFCQSDRLGWEETEERLYAEIPMQDEAQKVSVSDTAARSAAEGLAGGYGMAALGAVVVLCGSFFLIHNVIQISIEGDVRRIGLLNAVGATEKQIRKIYHRQIWRLLVWGAAIGAALSAVLLLKVIPGILGRQYLQEVGGAEGLQIFRPAILLASVLFAVCVVLLASGGVIHRAVGQSCVESMKDTGMKEGKRPFRISLRRKWPAEEILYLAWRSLLGYRRRFVLTVLSLFLGMTAFLGTVVITSGSDYVHALRNRPDFLIAGQFGQFGREQGYGEEYKLRDGGEDPMQTDGSNVELLYDNGYDEFSPISPEVRRELLALDGVEEEKTYIMEGAYLYSQISKKGIRPLESGFFPEEGAASGAEMVKGGTQDVVQILKEDEIRALKEYVSAKGLPADMASLEEGTGVMILHDHALSPRQEELAAESVGEPVVFETMLSKEERIAWNQMSPEERDEREKSEDFPVKRSEPLALCGYLDSQAEDFPNLRRTWHGREGDINYLISEKGFEKLPTDKKTLYMELNVEQKRERAAKAEIERIISEENQRRSRMTEAAFDQGNGEAGIFCISRSDLMEEAAVYLQGNRQILGSISAVLLLAGCTNYVNVMFTGILARRRELETMESIGMTGRQKKAVILAAGGYYALLTSVLLLTVGTGILLLIRAYMEQSLSYFVFSYPAGWLLLLIGGMAGVCAVTAGLSPYWTRAGGKV